jgi:hypothetical protein
MNNTKNIYSPNNPIQSWCADMWSLLWNLLLNNYNIDISKNLDFAWSTEKIKSIKNKTILHNAGVLKNNTDLFFKGDFINKFPFNENYSYVNKDMCSFLYVKEILETSIYLKDILK